MCVKRRQFKAIRASGKSIRVTTIFWQWKVTLDNDSVSSCRHFIVSSCHQKSVSIMQQRHDWFSMAWVQLTQTLLMWKTGLPVWYGLPNLIVICTDERTCSLSPVIAKLKLHVPLLVQTARGFGNPCFSERLSELYPVSTKLIDKRLC